MRTEVALVTICVAPMRVIETDHDSVAGEKRSFIPLYVSPTAARSSLDRLCYR